MAKDIFGESLDQDEGYVYDNDFLEEESVSNKGKYSKKSKAKKQRQPMNKGLKTAIIFGGSLLIVVIVGVIVFFNFFYKLEYKPEGKASTLIEKMVTENYLNTISNLDKVYSKTGDDKVLNSDFYYEYNRPELFETRKEFLRKLLESTNPKISLGDFDSEIDFKLEKDRVWLDNQRNIHIIYTVPDWEKITVEFKKQFKKTNIESYIKERNNKDQNLKNTYQSYDYYIDHALQIEFEKYAKFTKEENLVIPLEFTYDKSKKNVEKVVLENDFELYKKVISNGFFDFINHYMVTQGYANKYIKEVYGIGKLAMTDYSSDKTKTTILTKGVVTNPNLEEKQPQNTYITTKAKTTKGELVPIRVLLDSVKYGEDAANELLRLHELNRGFYKGSTVKVISIRYSIENISGKEIEILPGFSLADSNLQPISRTGVLAGMPLTIKLNAGEFRTSYDWASISDTGNTYNLIWGKNFDRKEPVVNFGNFQELKGR